MLASFEGLCSLYNDSRFCVMRSAMMTAHTIKLRSNRPCGVGNKSPIDNARMRGKNSDQINTARRYRKGMKRWAAGACPSFRSASYFQRRSKQKRGSELTQLTRKTTHLKRSILFDCVSHHCVWRHGSLVRRRQTRATRYRRISCFRRLRCSFPNHSESSYTGRYPSLEQHSDPTGTLYTAWSLLSRLGASWLAPGSRRRWGQPFATA